MRLYDGRERTKDVERKRFKTNYSKDLQTSEPGRNGSAKPVSVVHGFFGLGTSACRLDWNCLNHALLDDCDLTDANLTNAKLCHASFDRANLSGAILADVVADGASFQGATGLTPSAKQYLKSKGAKGLD
jgi:uncharacterized protein YjbI with pentapeptide repeats